MSSVAVGGTRGAAEARRTIKRVISSHVHDPDATNIHLSGLNHERLNFKYQGLDMRLTGNAGNVVKGVVG